MPLEFNVMDAATTTSAANFMPHDAEQTQTVTFTCGGDFRATLNGREIAKLETRRFADHPWQPTFLPLGEEELEALDLEIERLNALAAPIRYKCPACKTWRAPVAGKTKPTECSQCGYGGTHNEFTRDVEQPAPTITLPPRPTAPIIKRADLQRTRKSVEWAYPSSPNAERFNRAKAGCWVVEILTLGNPTSSRAICAHDDRNDALTAAKAIPCDWMASFVTIYPEDAK